MRYLFTAAAQRALHEAARWRRTADDPIAPPALLAGLTAESECRAAGLLAAAGVDQATIAARWPELMLHADAAARRSYHPQVEAAFRAAQSRLWAYPQPVELATEHLLLGLLLNEDETAGWLHERGLAAEAVEAEIHRVHGYDARPVNIDHLEGAEPLEIPPAPADNDLPMVGVPALAGSSAPTYEDRLKPELQRVRAGDRTPGEQVGIWRACDASANRAREALRVVEDYVRFVLDDRHLTECLKQLRHDLTGALAAIPRHARLASRETLRDVGTTLTTAGEQSRPDSGSVLAANFARLSEALRSLEEFGKLLGGELSAACEGLRYRAYTLERAVGLTSAALTRLATARLYVLIEGGSSLAALASQVDELTAHGVDVIQLRDKQLGDRELLERARVIAARVRETRTLFIMNDRPDLAALAGAAGVHVGQEELSVKDARAMVGVEALVGVSTHTLEQARQAVLDGADYIGLGPTFPSGTKSFAHFPGLDVIAAVSREIRLPAFAIGGITAENLDQVLAAGGSRIAVSGAVTRASSPGAAAAELARRLSRG